MTELVAYSRDPELLWDRKSLEWVVLREFQVTWNRPGRLPFTFVVPVGFRTDLASIPRALRSVVPVIGPNIQAAIAHDYCYVQVLWIYGRELTKAEADLLFLHGMESLEVPWLRRRLMYSAVRVGGAGRWVAA